MIKRIVLMLLIVFGLWVSLHYTFLVWGPDSDVCYSAMLWQGIHKFGFSFLKSVAYTPDNFLFSLVPFYFILFLIFGVNSYMIVVVGWLIFSISAFLSGYIFKIVTNEKFISQAVFIVISLCLFVGIYNNTAAWLVYANTHNMSMLWVLIDFIIVLRVFSNKLNNKFLFILYYFLLYFVTFIAGFSDPWFNAAFNLPMLLTLLTIYFIEPKFKAKAKVSIIAILLAWFVSYTKVFGLLNFIPSSRFIFISSFSQFKLNIYYYITSIASFFNLTQAFDFNILVGIIFAFLSFFVFLTVIKKIVTHLQLYSFDILQKVGILFMLSSIIVVSSAFLLSTFPQGLYSARFLVNIFYFMIILFTVVIFNEKNKNGILKKENFLMILYFIFYIFIGLNGPPSAWLHLKIKPKKLGISQLIQTLQKNNLHFGYGDYWSAEVNSINVLTKGKILVAGITSNLYTPHKESSYFFFDVNKIPKETNYFLIIPNHPTFEWRLTKEESMKKAIMYFGDPVKIITLANNTILIWNHPLLFNKIFVKQFSILYSSSQNFLSSGQSLSNLYPQYLESHGYLDKSFGYQTGAAKNWTQDGGWIGQWDCPDGKGKCFGIGLVGDINILKPIIDKYKPQALRIFFPYPKIYNQNTKETNGQLLMIFRASGQ